jgi:hypothetical protein
MSDLKTPTARTFVVEDESHCESFARFDSMEAAVGEIRRLSKLPWDEEPNCCPCTSWRTCSREWFVAEYETVGDRTRHVRSTDVICEVGSAGVRWFGEVD